MRVNLLTRCRLLVGVIVQLLILLAYAVDESFNAADWPALSSPGSNLTAGGTSLVCFPFAKAKFGSGSYVNGRHLPASEL